MIPNFRALECEYGIRVKESAKYDCRLGILVKNCIGKVTSDVSEVTDVTGVTGVTSVTNRHYERILQTL